MDKNKSVSSLISVPYDPNAERAPSAVNDSIFHERIPATVADIIKVMIIDDDNARAKYAADKKTGPLTMDYNPIWNILLDHINSVHKRVDKLLEPLEFEYKAGRPLMLVKLGSESKGWIPDARHFDTVRKVLKASGTDKSKNILLYHYGIHIDERP